MTSDFFQDPPAACPTPFNFADYVLQHKSELNSKTALCIVNQTRYENWTYGNLSNLIQSIISQFKDAYIGPEDVLLMRLGNTLDFPATYLAALAMGAVPVPTSPMLTEAELSKIISELKPKAIVRDPDLTLPAADIPQIHLSKDIKSGRDLSFHMGDPNRLGYIVYTSGTSGNPMAVAHAHRAIWARRMMLRDWYDIRPTDRMFHAGAFNWTFTMGTGLMDPWSVGATSLIPEPGTDPEDIPFLLKDHGATLFAAAPGVYRKLLKQKVNLSHLSLRHGLCAGEKLSEDIRKAWQDATGTDLHEAFGMSECSTFISGSPSRPSKHGTLGRPQNGRRVAILNDGHPAPVNTPGMIAVHRSDPGLMLGYHSNSAATAQKFQGDWFLTGDLGAMDDAGNITYLGRADDMMNAGGYRVSPLEVEAVLRQFPDIDQVAVTDVTVAKDARVIAAFYTSASTIAPEAVKAFANSHLARYKQPRIYQQVDSLPTNPNGKLSRKLLRQFFEAQHDRTRET
ncbi:class I adenylate-forming enzyme family protein [Cognatishimia sp.]|uniref:class I adenylate-forming enzyme family protein n=1 Tax=Cognatishimia sp. TaxID=2211648 RepID=UPI0035127C08